MTTEKKLYEIAELFNDDMAVVATAIKCCGSSERQSVILHRINTLNTDKIALYANMMYNLTRDKYNIDGIVSFVELVHKNSVHDNDHTFDEDKNEQGLLFYED